MKQEQKTVECCGKPLQFESVKAHSSASCRKEVATCPKCDTWFERKQGSDIVYRGNDEKKQYECVTCGATIMGACVAHPVWEFPEHLAGFGECRYEDVPYCPNCEKKPGFHDGKPIRGG